MEVFKNLCSCLGRTLFKIFDAIRVDDIFRIRVMSCKQHLNDTDIYQWINIRLLGTCLQYISYMNKDGEKKSSLSTLEGLNGENIYIRSNRLVFLVNFGHRRLYPVYSNQYICLTIPWHILVALHWSNMHDECYSVIAWRYLR